METRPWLKNYPAGVPANINESEYESLLDFFKEVFEKYKSNNAFECMGQIVTYGEVDKLSTQFGAYLHSRGLEAGR
jgi:long-chain acyl-CoA synthetase